MPLVYFDGPGGTRCPDSVLEAVSGYLLACNANLGGKFLTSMVTEEVVGCARAAASDLLGAIRRGDLRAEHDDVELRPSRTAARDWEEGDEVIVTRLDHTVRLGIVHTTRRTRSTGCSAPSASSPQSKRWPRRDYSATPLAKKLGAKPGAEVVVFFTTRRDRAQRGCRAEGDARPGRRALDRMAEEGVEARDRPRLRRGAAAGLDAGLVDNKSCAIDEDWQALRFVYRLADR